MSNKVTNDKGFNFEIDKSLTDWAHSDEGSFKKVLPKHYIVLKVTKEDKIKGYILFNTKEQKPIFDRNNGAEDMAVHLTMMKAKMNMEE